MSTFVDKAFVNPPPSDGGYAGTRKSVRICEKELIPNHSICGRCGGVVCRYQGEAEQEILDNFVSLFRLAPVNAEIAKSGGLYRRDYGKSHGVGLADAIIAATCAFENAELKTLNVKHYPMLKGLRSAYRK